MAPLKALANWARVARALTLQSGAEHVPAIGLPRARTAACRRTQLDTKEACSVLRGVRLQWHR